MLNYGNLGHTISVAVTSSASDAFTADATSAYKVFTLVVSSDRAIHLSRGSDAAIATGARVPAETPVRLTVFGGDRLSAILATGESSGTIWVTVVD